jgi:hypothetical protein
MLIAVVAFGLARRRARRPGAAAALATMLVVAGCHGHVALNAPPAGSDAAERIAAFERLQSRGRMDLVRTQHGRTIEQSAEFIVLADGRRVYHADDLIAVVGQDSPAGNAAAQSARARRKKIAWYTVGAAGMVVGVALLYATTLDTDLEDPEDGLSGTFWASMGLSAAGALAVTVGLFYGREEKEARAAAFMTFDDSLMQKLDLCAEGTRVIDCASAPTPQPVEEEHAAWGGVTR